MCSDLFSAASLALISDEMKFFRLATSCRSVSISCLRVQRLLAVGARDQVLRAQPDQTGCQQRGAGTQADQEWFEPGQQARIDFKRARLLGRDDENGGSCDARGQKTVNDRTGHGTARKTPHDSQPLSLHLKRRLGA
ncbi:MAG TPA: hypothetical protein PLA28_13040 [Ottowia sp.]|nr:hypothetical protein [Ottowia sp.]HRL67895.1 hypothetical protein [Ottowia sp.]